MISLSSLGGPGGVRWEGPPKNIKDFRPFNPKELKDIKGLGPGGLEEFVGRAPLRNRPFNPKELKDIKGLGPQVRALQSQKSSRISRA